MSLLQIGQLAPTFRLRDVRGDSHDLRSFRGEPLVLYFYPKDDTSVCTKQACQFTEALPRFVNLKIPVVGISPDDEASHRRFAEKHSIGFTLLADVPGEDGVPPVCRAFGVWGEKVMYGRRYMGVVRTTYLIGPDGKVVARWDRVRITGHAEAVLAAARGMASSAVKVKRVGSDVKNGPRVVGRAGRSKGSRG